MTSGKISFGQLPRIIAQRKNFVEFFGNAARARFLSIDFDCVTIKKIREIIIKE